MQESPKTPISFEKYPVHSHVLQGVIPLEFAGNGEMLNMLDCYGIPPIHYAIHMGRVDIVDWLIGHGANPLLRNRWGFNAYQEAVCSRRIDVIQLTYDKAYDFYDKIYSERAIAGSETLARMHDFEFTLHWELQTWIPLGSYLLPSDNNVVRKRGPNLRFDMNIVGFEGYRMKRGNCSLFFFGEDHEAFKLGDVILVNYDDRTITNLCGNGSRRKLKTEEVMKTTVTTMQTVLNFDCTRSKTLLGKDRVDMVDGVKCSVYDVAPFWAQLVTREPPTVPEEDSGKWGDIYTPEFYQAHRGQNILLREGEKQQRRKRTMSAEMWVRTGSIQTSQFRILMSFLSTNFDDFSRFENFFITNELDDSKGFPVQFSLFPG